MTDAYSGRGYAPIQPDQLPNQYEQAAVPPVAAESAAVRPTPTPAQPSAAPRAAMLTAIGAVIEIAGSGSQVSLDAQILG
ncbi:hypothetical protein, partial [Sphingorhabdus sp.]|uniref:hypothetical protein n=1 Tax=Sphingorhabdus sp. TaxID=1902408 RepID=UPI003BB1E0B0